MADDLTPPVQAGGILLFSYGTLQQPDVQLATFGRHLGGERDPVLVASDRADAAVDGTVFTITAAELAAADEYEVDDYSRVLVSLRSGRQAWVYALAEEGNGDEA